MANRLTLWYAFGVQMFPAPAQITGRSVPQAIGAVALGGVIGATLRWVVGTAMTVSAGTWPWPTLIVNLVGCALIGVALRTFERDSLRWDFAVTGVLGAFTTMSSFAVELNGLVDAGRSGVAVAYGAVTVIVGIGLVAAVARTAPSTETTTTGTSTGRETTR